MPSVTEDDRVRESRRNERRRVGRPGFDAQPQHGQVGGRIVGHHLGVENLTSRQRRGDPGGVAGDMVVGQHVSFRRDDDSAPRPGPSQRASVGEVLVDDGQVDQRRVDDRERPRDVLGRGDVGRIAGLSGRAQSARQLGGHTQRRREATEETAAAHGSAVAVEEIAERAEDRPLFTTSPADAGRLQNA